MQRISILARMILAVCVVALGVAAVVSWIGAEVAASEVERRLVDDMAANCGALLARLRLPPSPRMLRHLAQVSDGEIAVGPPGSNRVVSSTLSDADTAALRQALDGSDLPRRVDLPSRSYVIGFYDLDGAILRNQQSRRLYVLIPEARIHAAKDATRRRILRWTLLVLAVALAATVLLSLTVTRPLRRLTERIDHLSQEASASGDELPALELPVARRSPKEVRQLASSFDRLLHSLNAAQERLTRVERLAALGKTAASVAHELRNPLSGIKMHLRLLTDAVSAEDDEESLDLISREVERMDLFLAELMALAKGDAAGQVHELTHAVAVDLAAEVRHVAALLEGKLKHAEIQFQLSVADDLPPVQGDPTRLRQVILNLLLNAVEAMPAGGALEVRVVPSGASALRLSIRDHGVGVPADLGDRIFQPFVTSRRQGAGLGLHVCRQVIRAHGSEIHYRAHSAGTEFWFELPTTDEDDT